MAQANEALVEAVEAGHGLDNALDMAVEIALFREDPTYCAVRANAAGTKLIYTEKHSGRERTCRAFDWTADRPHTATLLRARSKDHPHA